MFPYGVFTPSRRDVVGIVLPVQPLSATQGEGAPIVCWNESLRSGSLSDLRKLLPLPGEGEGWGEGELNVRLRTYVRERTEGRSTSTLG